MNVVNTIINKIGWLLLYSIEDDFSVKFKVDFATIIMVAIIMVFKYFSQSQLWIAKKNEDRTTKRNALLKYPLNYLNFSFSDWKICSLNFVFFCFEARLLWVCELIMSSYTYNSLPSKLKTTKINDEIFQLLQEKLK